MLGSLGLLIQSLQPLQRRLRIPPVSARQKILRLVLTRLPGRQLVRVRIALSGRRATPR